MTPIKRMAIAVSAALALVLAASNAGAAFQYVELSPRARAMGGAGVAVADDAFAAVLNPAALVTVGQPTLGTSFVKPYGLSFAQLVYAGGAVPLGPNIGTLGFGLRRFGVEWDAVDLMRETTFTVAHGLKVYKDIHSAIQFGAAANVYHLKFGPDVSNPDTTWAPADIGSDTAVGLDLGLLVTLRERTRLGVRVANINNPQIGLANEEIQQRLLGGVAYAPYDGVWTTFEFENRLGRDVIYHGGFEIAAPGGLLLRGGAQTNPGKLCAGFGYAYHGMTLVYGFSTGGGTLESSHQFGLTFAWGGEAP